MLVRKQRPMFDTYCYVYHCQACKDDKWRRRKEMVAHLRQGHGMREPDIHHEMENPQVFRKPIIHEVTLKGRI